MKLYNTLTRKKEEFNPLEGNTVRIYSCGPTVYNYAHIGNLRAYVFMDILRKTLQYNGYELKHVMNITDVGHLTSDADEGEDKVEKAAREQKKDPLEITKFYTEAFFEDLKRLHIGMPEIIAKATDHIPEMLAYVEKIIENGYAYETSKGIYFDISKLDKYGELSYINIDDQKAGARVDIDVEKRHPLDFALWIKAPENHIMKWESPWGLSYPGWHIECSAMSTKYLGEVFDIHTGGVDHIPIHHENEIAQAKGNCNKIPAKIWAHNEFVLIDGGKMSKSLGNIYTIEDLKKKGYEPLAYRYFCLNTHYRNKLNFTFDGIAAAQVALGRLREGITAHSEGTENISFEELEKDRNEFREAMNDDLNTPKALAILWTIIRSDKKSKQYLELIQEFDQIFSLDLDIAKIKELEGNKEKRNVEELPNEIKEFIAKRIEARENKNWAESDRIREQLINMGYTVVDTKDGMTVSK